MIPIPRGSDPPNGAHRRPPDPRGGAETCPVTAPPIRADFAPDGYERVDPPEAVTVLLHPDDLRASIGKDFNEINADVCGYQPFSHPPPRPSRWLAAAHPGGIPRSGDE